MREDSRRELGRLGRNEGDGSVPRTNSSRESRDSRRLEMKDTLGIHQVVFIRMLYFLGSNGSRPRYGGVRKYINRALGK